MSRFRVVAGVAALAVIVAPTAALAKGGPGGGGGGGGKGPKQNVISVPGNQTVSESAGSINVPITRSGDTSCAFTLHYATQTNNSAAAGQDYTATSGDQTWVAGETSKPVSVTILEDSDAEQTETFKFVIGPLTTSCNVAIAIKGSTDIISITDNDDADGDGVADGDDNCPNDANADQADADSDTVGDVCDAFPNDPTETTDTDGDGVGDNSDNCADVANPGQEDIDGGGAGEACDNQSELVGTSTGTEDGQAPNAGAFSGNITNTYNGYGPTGHPDGTYAGQFSGGGGDASTDCGINPGFYIGGAVTLTYGGNSVTVDLDDTKSFFCVTTDNGSPEANEYSAHWEGDISSGTGDWGSATGSVSYDGTTSGQDVDGNRTDSGTWSGLITL